MDDTRERPVEASEVRVDNDDERKDGEETELGRSRSTTFPPSGLTGSDEFEMLRARLLLSPPTYRPFDVIGVTGCRVGMRAEVAGTRDDGGVVTVGEDDGDGRGGMGESRLGSSA